MAQPTPFIPDESDEVSLEELAAVYARALGMTEPKAQEPTSELKLFADDDSTQTELPVTDGGFSVSPLSVVEAALFVGHPSNHALSASLLASMMRDVSLGEIDELVVELNQIYRRDRSAMCIEASEGGYRMTLVSAVETIRTAFYGRAREARLNQAAIDVLALIAYQPGVTAAEMDVQRGKGSAGVAAQLVRRRLVELRREIATNGSKVSRYFPTDRFLKLFSINSLSDLPQVDEELLPRNS